MQQFEGDTVNEFVLKIPATTVEGLQDAMARGTMVRLWVDARVKSVRLEEDRHGDLNRQHILSIEGVQVKAAYNPSEALDDVAGGASSMPSQDPEGAAELGVEIGRTADTWHGKPDEAVGF